MSQEKLLVCLIIAVGVLVGNWFPQLHIVSVLWGLLAWFMQFSLALVNGVLWVLGWVLGWVLSGIYWVTASVLSGISWVMTSVLSGISWVMTSVLSGIYWVMTSVLSGIYWVVTSVLFHTVWVIYLVYHYAMDFVSIGAKLKEFYELMEFLHRQCGDAISSFGASTVRIVGRPVSSEKHGHGTLVYQYRLVEIDVESDVITSSLTMATCKVEF